jgi:hypothetical protein
VLGTNVARFSWIFAGSLVLPLHTAASQVTTAQYDNARSGSTSRETLLSPRSVTVAGFGRVAALSVDGDVYAQPLYLPSVAIPAKENAASSSWPPNSSRR